MILKADEVLRVMGLVYDTFDVNGVDSSAAVSACINVVIRILVKEGVPESLTEQIIVAMEKCIKSLNTESYIETVQP